MATFITDPRIAYAQAARNDYRKRSLAPIQLPRNPYGGSPVASALQNLTYGYLAGQEGRQANRLQEAQTAAQNKIMGQILRDQQATAPGAGGYFTQTQANIPDTTGAVAEFGRGVGTFPQQTRLTMNQPTRPTMQPIDARVAKTAGIDPAQLAMLRMKAIQQGDDRTKKAIEGEAKKGLQNALLLQTEDGMNLARQYQSIIDPSASLNRAMDRAENIESDMRTAGLRGENVIDRATGQVSFVADAVIYDPNNRGRYQKLPPALQPRDTPTWVGTQYNELLEKSDLAQTNLNMNEQMMGIVKSRSVKTGFFAPILKKFRSAISGMTDEPSTELSAAEILDAMSGAKALAVRNPKSGLGLPGATSRRDLEYLDKIVPGLSKSNEANEALLIIDTAINRRKVADYNARMNYISLNPTKGIIGYDVSDQRSSLAQSSLFTSEEKAMLEEITKSPRTVGPLNAGASQQVPVYPGAGVPPSVVATPFVPFQGAPP